MKPQTLFRFVFVVVFVISLNQAGICQAQTESGATEKRNDDQRPRVLIIGDSISMGYTRPVANLMKDVARVERPKGNCASTREGIAKIDQWLGDVKWDVIHFNWGLHDLKYMGPNGENLADPKASSSRQKVSKKDYEANLTKLVKRLQATGATLVWCSTTPVPEGCRGRIAATR